MSASRPPPPRQEAPPPPGVSFSSGCFCLFFQRLRSPTNRLENLVVFPRFTEAENRLGRTRAAEAERVFAAEFRPDRRRRHKEAAPRGVVRTRGPGFVVESPVASLMLTSFQPVR